MFIVDDMEVSVEAFKCYLLGKSFIHSFEELLECNNEYKIISLIENMKNNLSFVRKLKDPEKNKPLLTLDLDNWFFCCFEYPSDIMNNPTKEKEDIYINFYHYLDVGYSIEEALQKSIQANQKKDLSGEEYEVLNRHDAEDKCYYFGRGFIKHFERIYDNPDSKDRNHWIEIMYKCLNSIKRIKLDTTNEPFNKTKLTDYFFTAWCLPEDFMKNPTEDKIEAYDKFFHYLQVDYSIEEALNKINI